MAYAALVQTDPIQDITPEVDRMLGELYTADTANAALAALKAGDTFTGAINVLAATTATEPARVDQINTRRKIINVHLGAVATNPEGIMILVVPESDRYAIQAVKLVCDISTTGSDASNRWDFAVIKVDLTALQSTVKTTNGAEITGFVAYDLGVDQNNAVGDLVANAVYLVTITKTGTPTDLSSADLSFQIDLTETLL